MTGALAIQARSGLPEPQHPDEADRFVGSVHRTRGFHWQHTYIESFNDELRDDFVRMEICTSLGGARSLAASFRDDYNHQRPHSALGGRSSSEFTVGLRPNRRAKFWSATDVTPISDANAMTETDNGWKSRYTDATPTSDQRGT
jgi:hypothetical protein